MSYANLSVDGLVVETRMGARFDPPPPDPDSPAHQWAQLEGPAVLVLHPGLRHDGTLYLVQAKQQWEAEEYVHLAALDWFSSYEPVLVRVEAANA